MLFINWHNKVIETLKTSLIGQDGNVQIWRIRDTIKHENMRTLRVIMHDPNWVHYTTSPSKCLDPSDLKLTLHKSDTELWFNTACLIITWPEPVWRWPSSEGLAASDAGTRSCSAIWGSAHFGWIAWSWSHCGVHSFCGVGGFGSVCGDISTSAAWLRQTLQLFVAIG